MKKKLSLLAMALLASTSAFANDTYSCGSFDGSLDLQKEYSVHFVGNKVTLKTVTFQQDGSFTTDDQEMNHRESVGELSRYESNGISATVVTTNLGGELKTTVEISKTLNCPKLVPIH